MNHFTEANDSGGLENLCFEKVGDLARKEAGKAERHRAKKARKTSLWKTAVFQQPVKDFGAEGDESMTTQLNRIKRVDCGRHPNIRPKYLISIPTF